MEGTKKEKEYQNKIKTSIYIKKKKEEQLTGYKKPTSNLNGFSQWEEKESNMHFFNILAKCAAKELKQLKCDVAGKENKHQSVENLSDTDNDLMDIKFPCDVVENKKTYKCNYPDCTKKFPSLSRMRRHYIIHTGVKPFKCLSSKCNKSFSRRDNMIQHYKGHCTNSSAKQ